jgi:nitric oxide reductase large subunit
MAAGLRRLGDVSAVVLGLPLVALSWVVAGLSNLGDNHRDGPLATAFAVMQVAMLLFAAHDLRNNKNTQSRPIKLAYRMLGLALPLILLVVSCSMNQRGGAR